MPWMDLSNMECVRSYDECVRMWKKNAPLVRKRSAWDFNQVPLDGVYKPHVSLVFRGEAQSFSCRLYANDMIMYKIDGTVLLYTYDSIATVSFCENTAPVGAHPFSVKGVMWWRIETLSGPAYYQSSVLMEPTREAGKWSVIRGEGRTVAKVHWRRLPKALKLIEPLMQWKAAVERMEGGKFSDLGALVYDLRHPSMQRLIELIARSGIIDTKLLVNHKKTEPDRELMDYSAARIKLAALVAMGVIEAFEGNDRYPGKQPTPEQLQKLPEIELFEELI